MKKALVAKLALAGTVGLAAAMASGTANATDCNACHTMHNSQNGASMRFDTGATPLPILLRGSCIWCHSGINTNTSIATTPPKVIGTAAPVYSGDGAVPGANTLAGGDFWYVGNGPAGQSSGHNVGLVDAFDTILDNNPPGGADLVTQLQCAGTKGCHGDPLVADPLASLSGAHHSAHNDVNDVLAGTTVGTSFRYLLGVLGREDTDWQYTEDGINDHNRYNGVIRNADTGTADTSTISGLCATCHGAYHNIVDGDDAFGINTDNGDFTAGQWIRHPTDYDMSTNPATEYFNYDTYSNEAPVGRIATALGDPGADVSATHRIVLCVSCHRAHGSPYADALRWSYGEMDVGAGVVTGCMRCHTAK